jgi:hypothetical protein
MFGIQSVTVDAKTVFRYCIVLMKRYSRLRIDCGLVMRDMRLLISCSEPFVHALVSSHWDYEKTNLPVMLTPKSLCTRSLQYWYRLFFGDVLYCRFRPQVPEELD